MNDKGFDEQYTLEQLRQNFVLLNADTIELPRKYLIDLIILAQRYQYLLTDTELNKIVDVCYHQLSEKGCTTDNGQMVDKTKCPCICPLNKKGDNNV